MDERNKTAPIPVGAGSSAADPVVEMNEAELDGYRPKKRRATNTVTSTESSSGLREVFLDREEPAAGRGTHGTLPPLLPVQHADADVAKTPIAHCEITDPGGSKDGLLPVTPAVDFQPPENFDEYVVKYGDTLSGIAQRTLGSQKKYMDIYHANQDRMASPDRLDVGKPLRIPRVADNGATDLLNPHDLANEQVCSGSQNGIPISFSHRSAKGHLTQGNSPSAEDEAVQRSADRQHETAAARQRCRNKQHPRIPMQRLRPGPAPLR